MTSITDSEKQDSTRHIQLERRQIIDLIGENGFIIIFIVWCIYLSLATPTFLTSTNLTLVLRQSAIVSIVAIGETMIVLLAGIDVSLASILGLSAVGAVWLMVNGISRPGGVHLILT